MFQSSRLGVISSKRTHLYIFFLAASLFSFSQRNQVHLNSPLIQTQAKRRRADEAEVEAGSSELVIVETEAPKA